MADHHNYMEALLDPLQEIYNEKIPFNKVLGLQIELSGTDNIGIRINMKDELIGNYAKGFLHGGVISSVLDVAGGIIATLGALEKLEDASIEQFLDRITKVGTIDLRIDYLRPGRGEYFLATGSVLRTGKRVAVTRMEFRNEKGLLIAVGTGTYIVA